MSFSRPVENQHSRVSSNKARNMKSSPTKGKHSVEFSSQRHQHQHKSPDTKEPQPDSGFFDGSDGELYGDTSENEFQYNYSNNKDWILFADVGIDHDQDYYFAEEDAVDIASTKANHGSLYNGKNNEDNTLIANSSSPSRPVLEVARGNSRGTDPPHHYSSSPSRPVLEVSRGKSQGTDPPHHYSYHPHTQYGPFQLQTWKHTFEQHESIAYRFEQPPNPSHVFHDLQQSWHEDIDLDVYAVLF